MHRGEIWTLRDNRYASKARPVIVIQDESVATFDSIVLCLLTTFDSKNIDTRVKIEPTARNGLAKTSFVMTEKLVSVDKALLGEHIGEVSSKKLNEISEQLRRVLGL